ncbi:MAG: SGNH/GDSL hydrolase family protein [Lachnospiraceae bacterium]|nr:SGNH/GDSL hydrolase family protein [Lachnospiraceae bacterium]
MKEIIRLVCKKKYEILGAVLMLLLLGGLFWRGPKTDYEVLCLGDSIFGNVQNETSIPGLLKKETGLSVLNGGFGGMTLAQRNVERRGDIQEDCFSLVGISESLAAGDFSWQKGSMEEAVHLDYFPQTVSELETVSMDCVEIIVIEYGVNDYLNGLPLENKENPYDKYTFAGALRYVLEFLQDQYPDKQIVLCTPTYCWFPEENADCSRKNTGYGVLEDYVNLEKIIGQEYNVMVLDNYHESGIGNGNVSWQEYTEDGLHLNEAGRKLIAKRIAECIKSEGK